MCSTASTTISYHSEIDSDEDTVRLVFDIYDEAHAFAVDRSQLESAANRSIDNDMVYAGSVSTLSVAAMVADFVYVANAECSMAELCEIFLSLCCAELEAAVETCFQLIMSRATIADFDTLIETASALGIDDVYGEDLKKLCYSLVKRQLASCNFDELCKSFYKLSQTLIRNDNDASLTHLLGEHYNYDPELKCKLHKLIKSINHIAKSK